MMRELYEPLVAQSLRAAARPAAPAGDDLACRW